MDFAFPDFVLLFALCSIPASFAFWLSSWGFKIIANGIAVIRKS